MADIIYHNCIVTEKNSLLCYPDVVKNALQEIQMLLSQNSQQILNDFSIIDSLLVFQYKSTLNKTIAPFNNENIVNATRYFPETETVDQMELCDNSISALFKIADEFVEK